MAAPRSAVIAVMAVLASIGFCLSNWVVRGQGQAAVAAEWQYKTLTSPWHAGDPELTKLLNEQAHEGWEMLSSVPITFNNAGLEAQVSEKNASRIRTTVMFVFKRPRTSTGKR